MPSPLERAAAAFRNPVADVRARRFPVKTRVTSIQRQKDILKRRDAKIFKELVNGKNADLILDALPVDEGDRLHAVICGDFVYCDLVTRMVDRLGPPVSMALTTLSLSKPNLEDLERMLTRYPGFPLHLVLSHYFQTTSKELFVAVETMLLKRFPHRFRVSVGRSHCKVGLLDYGAEGCFVIEESANLRSARCFENLAIFRDRALFEMHHGWIEEFAAVARKEMDDA